MTERKIPDIGLSAEQIREIGKAFEAALKSAADAFADLTRELRVNQAMAHGRAAGTTSGMRKLVEVLEALDDADLAEVRSAVNHLDHATRREESRRQMEREKVS